MRGTPALELLQNTHSFPCPYMFKAIGKSENGFVARVIAAVREETAQEVDPPFSVRETNDGRHVAVTLTPLMQTAFQVIVVYERLQSLKGLVMLW